jgi:hypothetical protein
MEFLTGDKALSTIYYLILKMSEEFFHQSHSNGSDLENIAADYQALLSTSHVDGQNLTDKKSKNEKYVMWSGVQSLT